MPDSYRKTLFLILMVSAALTAGIRFFTLTDLGYDTAIQIQAAQRFLAGEGLTTLAQGKGFLVDKTPVVLTHWACAYSFYAAFVLWLGLPLYMVTNIFGVLGTLLGWWGWGKFMLHCLPRESANRGGWWSYCCLAMAFFLPMFTTPYWAGTDIFSWAAAPWVLEWLSRAGRASGSTAYRYYAAAGFLCGLSCIVRYASVVLAVCAGLVVILQNWPSLKKIFLRLAVFGLASLPPLILQFSIFSTVRSDKVMPGGIHGGGTWVYLAQRLWDGIMLLPTWNLSLLFWMPDSISKHFLGKTSNPFLGFAVVFLLAAFAALVFVQVRKNVPRAFFSDPKTGACILLCINPLILLACMGLGSWTYVGDRRYYMVFVPLAFLLVLFLANSGSGLPGKLTAAAARLFIIWFLAMSMVGTVFFFIPGPHGEVMRNRLGGCKDVTTFPRTGLKYEDSAMRAFVIDALKRNPEMHLLTIFDAAFHADTSLDHRKIHRVPECIYISGTSITGPKEILIATVYDADGKPYAVDPYGSKIPADCLDQLKPFTTLKVFDEVVYPPGKIAILRAEIPEGKVIRF